MEEQQKTPSKKDIEKYKAKQAGETIAKQAGSLALQSHGVPAPLADMAANKIAENKMVKKAIDIASTKNPMTRKALSNAAPVADQIAPAMSGNALQKSSAPSKSLGGSSNGEASLTPQKSSDPIKAIMNKSDQVKEKGQSSLNQIAGDFKKMQSNPIFKLLITPPGCFIFGGLIVIFFFLIIIVLSAGGPSDGASAGGAIGRSQINCGATTTLDNLKVQILYNDKTEMPNEVYDFWSFVKGVLKAELDPSTSQWNAGTGPDAAYYQTMAIAIASYTLSRTGYKESDTQISIRSSSCDLHHCDIVYGCKRVSTDKTCGDINISTISANNSISGNGELWKSASSDEQLKMYQEIINSVKGNFVINGEEYTGSNFASTEWRGGSTDTCSGKLEYTRSNPNPNFMCQNWAKDDSKDGMNYQQIISKYYLDNNTNWNLLTNIGLTGNTTDCNSNQNYGTYNGTYSIIPTTSATMLSETLSSFLTARNSSVEAWNEKVKNEVQKAGFATREGVVAAAATLVNGLHYEYDIALPYEWGGKYNSGLNPNWGSKKETVTDKGNKFYYAGLDCSGFTTWSLFNGGFSYDVEDSYHQRTWGTEKNFDEYTARPGDLLWKEGHIALVVDAQPDHYLIAEAVSNGVMISKYALDGNTAKGDIKKWCTKQCSIVDMDVFYNSSTKRIMEV